MTHKESATKIYYSQDYAMFRTINGNRQLSERKIKSLKRDITSGLDMLRFCPIIVEENEQTSTLDIIDGQHRFWVCKLLKSAIWYVVAPKVKLTDIAKVNNNTEKWKTADYINCFVQNGNLHYVQLEAFMDQYKLPLSVSLNLLSGNTVTDNGGGVTEQFKRGYFEVKEKEKAVAVGDLIMRFSDFPGFRNRPFITALSVIINGGVCDIEVLISKFKKDPAKLTKCGSPKDYLVQLETIYNFGNHKRQTIF